MNRKMPIGHRTALTLFLAAATLAAGSATAQTSVKFTLDWKFQGPTSAFLVAAEKGYYKAEGLDVTIDSGNGSAGAMTRVAGGAYQMGFADINALIEFNAANPGQAVKSVMMVYDAPPFSVFTLKSKNIATPKDLEGKVLGAPVFDASYKLFPTFAHKVGIDDKKVVRKNMEPPLREPMLIRGEVDFISGHFFSSFLDLKSKGVKESDLVYFRYADFGMDFYGNAIIAHPKFIVDNPKAVSGFLKATTKAMKEVLADPKMAVAVVKKRDPLTEESVELERLDLAIKTNIVTPWVKSNGMGDVDMARLQRSIDQVAQAVGLTKPPKAEELFVNAFLPPKAERMIAN
jgi:NitT/TauT family transport system substrate-binding protein